MGWYSVYDFPIRDHPKFYGLTMRGLFSDERNVIRVAPIGRQMIVEVYISHVLITIQSFTVREALMKCGLASD